MFVYVEKQLAVYMSHLFYGGGWEMLMVISVKANAHIKHTFSFHFALMHWHGRVIHMNITLSFITIL